jgi:hypothetical protein
MNFLTLQDREIQAGMQDKPQGRRNKKRWKEKMTLRVKEQALRLTLQSSW